MIFPIYAVRDSYTGFGIPVIRDNDAVASRAFEFDIHRSDSPYTVRSECYQLFQIGEYDTEEGKITPCSPRMICSAIDFNKE